MTYAITQTCCGDATCVSVCPVNCIHPTPGEPDFGTDGDAVHRPEDLHRLRCLRRRLPGRRGLPGGQPLRRAAGVRRDQRGVLRGPGAPTGSPAGPNFHVVGPEPSFDRGPARRTSRRSRSRWSAPDRPGCTPRRTCCCTPRAEVTLIDRLPVAGGLVRYGVAPDHPATKKVGDTFARFHTHPRVRMHLGSRWARDVTAEELAAHHDAVIYAVGASAGRRLGIPGEDLPGSICRDDVRLLVQRPPRGRPGRRGPVRGAGRRGRQRQRRPRRRPDPGSPTPTHWPAPTSPTTRWTALRAGTVREVVLLGRRGPEDAAYTRSELLALKHRPGWSWSSTTTTRGSRAAIDGRPEPRRPGRAAGGCRARGGRLVAAAPAGRRIVFRFHSAPVEVLGEDARPAVRVGGRRGRGRSGRTAAAGRRPPRRAGRRAAVRRGHRHRPARGRPGDGPAGDVRRGMDQARPLRRHRRQPRLRRRDGRHAPRRRGGGRARDGCAPQPGAAGRAGAGPRDPAALAGYRAV